MNFKWKIVQCVDWKIQEFMQRDRSDFMGVQDGGPRRSAGIHKMHRVLFVYNNAPMR